MSSSHDITLTPQEQALIMRLKSFRVPEMAHILEEQLKDPNADLNTFMERMTAMVDAEWQARADKRFNRLMKEAHLRYPAADLDETIYRPERQLDTQTIENTPLLLVTFPTTIVLSGRESNCTVACPTGLLSSPSITDPVTVMRLPLCAQERVAQVHTSNNNNTNFFIFSFSLKF